MNDAIKYISKAVVKATTALIFIISFLLPMHIFPSKKSSSLHPDFAYPKTAISNAEQNLKSAMDSGKWPEAILALIQKTTASNMISRDSIADAISTMEEYSAKMPEEWRPALILVEAQIYNSIYQNQHRKADNRELPTDSLPLSPYEWSTDMFADKTFNLCREILYNEKNDGKPLREWNSILTNTETSYKYGMTINEFLCLECVELLNAYSDGTQDVIPFFTTDIPADTPKQKCRMLRDVTLGRLIKEASSLNHDMIEAYAMATKANYLPISQRNRYLLSMLKKTEGTEGEQIILKQLASYIVTDNTLQTPDGWLNKKTFVPMLEKSIKSFPNGLYANDLNNILAGYISPTADIQYFNQYLSSADIRMDVTLNNCNHSWILVYDYSGYEKSEKSPTNKTMASTCPLVKAVEVSAPGDVPFSANVSAEIGKLPKGIYAMVASSTPDHKGIYPSIADQRWRQPFRVSDITVFSLSNLDSTTKVFVADGADGHPIEGATVKVFTHQNYNTPRTLAATLTTNKDGYATVLQKNSEIEALFQGSKWENGLRIFNTSPKTDSTVYHKLKILPDRGIYHPGDSLQAVIIAYSAKQCELSLDRNAEYTIHLNDGNGKSVASQDIVTDHFGRSTVGFSIPEEGLLGNWSLNATNKSGKSLDYSYFQVSDYVAPTFFIAADTSEKEEMPGDTVRLEGQILTFSGMPVAGATVDFTVNYRPPVRWYAPSRGKYSSSVTTDKDGKYIIALPTDNLKGTQFEHGIFNVEISATSPSGETQRGETQCFALGLEYSISPSRTAVDADMTDSIPPFIFNVRDMLGRTVRKSVRYSLINTASGKIVEEGRFMSPSLVLKKKNYIPAKYKLYATLEDDTLANAEMSVVLWRKGDMRAPEGTTLWIPESNIYAHPGASTIEISIGSGIADRWIPIAVSGNNKLMDFRWLHIDSENQTIPVKVPMKDEQFSVDALYISQLSTESKRINVYPAEARNQLEVTAETFRDKITAGDEEHWKFRFKKRYGTTGKIPVLAVMTDAALNQLAPFRWYFNPSGNYHQSFATFNTLWNGRQGENFPLKKYKYLQTKSFVIPDINDYGQNWGIGHYYNDGVLYATVAVNEMKLTSRAMKVTSDMEASGAIGDAATMDEAFTSGEESSDSESGSSAENSDDLRESEFPVAFFMPMLVTDNDGEVEIDFKVPNFNTRWTLQLIGYDESLHTAYRQLETVASKPVMVTTHSPRFVRTGDTIELTATIYNNTGEKADIAGRIELINLLDGKVITTKEFKPESVDAMASRLITLTWEVPSDVSSVGFRAYAETDEHRDGEQAILPVLPASSPVTESTPFWLAPDQKGFEIQLPKFNDSDKVTLQYCDNPTWYCLTALPDIMVADSKSVLNNAFALYGNAMAYNLISSNQVLKKGLETLLSDRNSEFAALKSNLEKDGNLKIAQLNNTPWINEAESETLRMSRLSTLLDSLHAEKVISDQIKSLQKLQTPSGGWSWCPDMRPSVFITGNVIYNFAMMEKAGALSKFGNYSDMIRSAVGFVDKELEEQYRKNHKKDESLGYLLNWIYIRSSLDKEDIPEGKNTSLISDMTSKALKDIASEWKGYSIRDKAEASIVLWRNGQKKTALEILESLRQYASETPQKGVWFDNLNSGYYGSSALATTTMVLKAFAEIEPENNLIEGLRQWLILSRQTEDWGRNIVTVSAINTILTAGDDRTPDTAVEAPVFHLGAHRVKVPAAAPLTGAFTVNIEAKQASGKKLKITRSADSPAWGGVISQYEAPLEDIKAANLPEMSIRKELVALVDGGTGTLVPKSGITLKKGMKVRVTLTISTDRDMDYVALTDERSACLEPTDQLSHYTSTDGIWYYKEVRNENTNLYFDFLPKGHHVISYDCTVAQDGTFSCGIATLQSQYAPALVCHSAADFIEVK